MARTAGSTNKPQFRMVTIAKLLDIFNGNTEREIPVSDKFIGGFLEFEGIKGAEAYNESAPTVDNTEKTSTQDEPDTSIMWHQPGEGEED